MTTPISEHISTLRRYRDFLAIAVAGGVLVGAILVAILPVRYTSQASIFISVISTDPTKSVQSTIRDVDMETEVRIAESRTIAERVAAQIEGADTELVLDSVSARAPQDSRVLEVRFEAESAHDAQLGAQAVAEGYLEFRSELAEEQTTVAREQIQALIDDVEAEFATAPDEVRRQVLQGELEAHQQALASLATVVLDPGEIIDDAPLPTSPSSIGRLPVLFGTIVAALVAAFGVIYLREAFRRANTDLDGSPAAAPTAPAGPELTAQSAPALPAQSEAEPLVEPALAGAETAGLLPGPSAADPSLDPVEPPAVPTVPEPDPTVEAASPVVEPDGAPVAADWPVDEAAPWSPPEAGFEAPDPASVPLLDDASSVADPFLEPVAAEPEPAVVPRTVTQDLDATLARLRECSVADGAVVAGVITLDSGSAAAEVALRLGTETAALGARTIVIDVGSVGVAHELLGRPGEPGLRDVAVGAVQPPRALQRLSDQVPLWLMAAGTTDLPTTTEQLIAVIGEARRHHDVVVLVSGTEDRASASLAATQAVEIIGATEREPGSELAVPPVLVETLADTVLGDVVAAQSAGVGAGRSGAVATLP